VSFEPGAPVAVKVTLTLDGLSTPCTLAGHYLKQREDLHLIALETGGTMYFTRDQFELIEVLRAAARFN
jgi:hypothetical protein